MSRIAAAASRAYRAAEYSSRRVGDVDQMMRDAAALVDRHLVGADVEAAIDGRRVAADDLAVEPLRERDAERALAGRGRPEDGDEPGAPAHSARRAPRTNASADERGAATTSRAELLRPRSRARSFTVTPWSARWLSLKKNVTVKNALSSGYSGGSGMRGIDARMRVHTPSG